MRVCASSALFVLAAVGCGGKADPAAPVVTPVPVDARVDAITSIGKVGEGVHLDEDVAGSAPARPSGPRSARSLELLLRSTPPGAIASVDGIAVGKTPILWEGDFTGREREFSFALAGYAVARYRFVPMANGVVHGTLDELTVAPSQQGSGASQPPAGQPKTDEKIAPPTTLPHVQPKPAPPPPPPVAVPPPIDASPPTPPPPPTEPALSDAAPVAPAPGTLPTE